jgi:hypothetical protein
VNIYLATNATIYVSTKHQPDRSSNMAAILENLNAIDPKLCTYVPLGKSNPQTKFRSSLILGQKLISLLIMAGLSPNYFYDRFIKSLHDRLLDMRHWIYIRWIPMIGWGSNVGCAGLFVNHVFHLSIARLWWINSLLFRFVMGSEDNYIWWFREHKTRVRKNHTCITHIGWEPRST